MTRLRMRPYSTPSCTAQPLLNGSFLLTGSAYPLSALSLSSPSFPIYPMTKTLKHYDVR
jgi:hypothetical protein